MKLGVIIGRFQTPYLHDGHKHLINSAMQENNQIMILLGSTFNDEKNERNPYSFEERIEMVRRDFPNALIYKLSDVPNDNPKWSSNVDEIVHSIMDIEGYDEAKLYHSRDSFKDFYSGSLETVEIKQIYDISATQIRESMKKLDSMSMISLTQSTVSGKEAKIEIKKLKKDVR